MVKYATTAQMRLQSDMQEARNLRDALGERMQTQDNRVLLVLAAGIDAHTLYMPALRRILSQLRATSRRANVVLVQSNGSVCPQDLQFEDTQRVDLCVPVKSEPGVAMPVHASGASPDLKYVLRDSADTRHTLHVIHQPPSPQGNGKIGALRDAFGMLLHSAMDGATLPSRTLFLDAESTFYQSPEDHLHAPDESTDGVSPLFDALDEFGAPHILGARMRLCAFRTLQSGERVPDFAEPISDLHTAINWAFGMPGHRYLSGGAIAGRTETLLALGQTVSKYPGLRSEDLAELALAQQLNLPWGISMEQVYANLCPAASDHAKAMQQLARWRLGKAAILNLYGLEYPEGSSAFERFSGRCRDAVYLSSDLAHGLRVLRQKKEVAAIMQHYPAEDPLSGCPEWTTS